MAVVAPVGRLGGYFRMDRRTQQRWRVFWVAVCLAVTGLIGAHAALVTLYAYVSYSIYGPGGTTPLANNSLVYIIGSSNSVIDPMASWGSPATNYIAGTTTGDDVFLGTVRIGDNVDSNGTFFVVVEFDSDLVKYVYLRFFDWQDNEPVTGMVYWGQSSNFFIGNPTLGVSVVDFNQDAPNSLIASNQNNFVVIPEPGTANLLILVAGMAWAMRTSMRRAGAKRAKAIDSEGSGS